MQRARRSVDERREQLIDATLAILATEGLPAATTRRITDEADVALGAFHYAFRSKDELLRAVIERMAAGMEQVFQAAGVEGSPDLATALERLIRGYWDFIESTAHVALAQFELTLHAMRDAELEPLAAWQYERFSSTIAAVLGEVPGFPADAEECDDLARFLLATMDGLVLHHCVQGDVEAGRRRLERYVLAVNCAPWVQAQPV